MTSTSWGRDLLFHFLFPSFSFSSPKSITPFFCSPPPTILTAQQQQIQPKWKNTIFQKDFCQTSDNIPILSPNSEVMGRGLFSQMADISRTLLVCGRWPEFLPAGERRERGKISERERREMIDMVPQGEEEAQF